jgi:magnesium-transporting ATPase (P-type)
MKSGPIYSLRPNEIFDALASSPDGLTSGEVAARLGQYGKNYLTEEISPAVWIKFLSYMAHPLAWLLWIAGAISFLVNEPVLGFVVWLLVFLNAGFSFWRDHRTEQAMNALRRLLPVYVRVMRDGVEVSVPADEIVPGDVLILAEGDRIPADARVVEAFGLRTNNAVLTGEANPARKTADASLSEGISELERPNLIFAGTSVVSGTGWAVVYATGMASQFGRIAHLTQSVREDPSPLQVELSKISRLISIVALCIGLIVFVVGSFGLGMKTYEAFLLALGIIVAAVPEGLPATMTLTLAMAGQRMVQHGVLVKKLSVIETLGIVSVICTDKSGTLTQNQMTVRELWVAGHRFKVTGGGYEPKGDIVPFHSNGSSDHELKLLLSAAALCNNSRLSPPAHDRPRWTALGDQTEAALRVLAMKGQIRDNELALVLPRVHELPFDARRKRMSTVHRLTEPMSLTWVDSMIPLDLNHGSARAEIAFVKGAPHEILQLSASIMLNQSTRPLDDATRAEIIAENDRYARQGLRVLALAFRMLPARTTAYTPENVECDLVFLGLVAMLDPARPEVAEAIQSIKQAGIRMVMITGDYGLTAESLARRLGMLSGTDTQILTGAELDEMDDIELQDLLDKEVVFARMAPEHKMRLVNAFQSRGNIVAVVGDGVNDAPAIRKADVGIALGVTGTDVAREAADIVFMNDSLVGLTHGIAEGRAIYDNLRKFITYIFSSNVPEILPFLLTGLFNIPLALTVRQILAIDLGTDLLPGLALGAEKPEPDIMRRPPRRRDQPLIDEGLLGRAFLWLGLIETALAYSGFILVYFLTGNGENAAFSAIHGWNLQAVLGSVHNLAGSSPSLLAITVFHAGVVMAQVGNAFAVRSELQRGHRLGWLSNRFLIQSLIVEIGLIFFLIYVPPIAAIFNHTPIPPLFWLWLLCYPFILYGLEWIRKFILRTFKRDHFSSVSQSG